MVYWGGRAEGQLSPGRLDTALSGFPAELLGPGGRGHNSAESALFLCELTPGCCISKACQAATCVTSFCHSLRSQGLCLGFSGQLIKRFKGWRVGALDWVLLL